METTRQIISGNITKYVEASKLSQKSIALGVGVSEPTLYRWKSGENSPDPDNIDKLAEVLGIDPDLFFEKNKTERRSEPVSIFAKKLMNIPDDIYEMAQEFSVKDDVWEDVRAAFENAREEIRAAKRTKG